MCISIFGPPNVKMYIFLQTRECIFDSKMCQHTFDTQMCKCTFDSQTCKGTFELPKYKLFFPFQKDKPIVTVIILKCTTDMLL